jgi:hypothetical protein
VLATVPLKPENILPGFARRLVGTWTPPDSTTGKLTFEASFTNPPGHVSKTVDFSAGASQRPAAKIENLIAKNDGGPLVTLGVRNTGSVPVAPTVVLTATQGRVERARTVIAQNEIPTGQAAAAEWRPSLGDGTYTITAQVKAGEALLDQAVTDLRIGAGPAPAAPPKAAHRRSPVIALAVLLFLAGLGLFLFLWRRRKDEPEEQRPQQAPAREPVGARR